MSRDELMTMHDLTVLKEEEPFTVYEINTTSVTEGVFGKTTIARYCKVDPETERRQEGELVIPQRLVVDQDIQAPCVVVYLGEKQLEGAKSCYDLKKVIGHDYQSAEELTRHADRVRKLSHQELRDMFKVSTFSEFKVGTVFELRSYKIEKLTSKKFEGSNPKVVVAKYECEEVTEDGRRRLRDGEIFMPIRLFRDEDPGNEIPGVCVYRGVKRSKKSHRDYTDVGFIKGCHVDIPVTS